MKILMLNTHNPFRASGIVALDLFNEFRKKGHQVELLVNKYDPKYPEGIQSMESFIHSYWETSFFRYKLDGVKKRLKIGKKINTDPNYYITELNEKRIYYKTQQLLKKVSFKPDVIIVLFAKEFINARNIFELYQETNAPVFWVMYDMGPLTGGCHYAWQCTGYQKNCGNCPGLFSSNPHDITNKNWEFKKRYIEKTNIQIVPNSEWQYRQAKISSIFRDKPINKIFLSVDPDIFKPVDKEYLREKMGVPKTKKILFFGSVELSATRKGMAFLLESLKILKELIQGTDLEKEVFLLVAGKGIDAIVSFFPFEYHYLGWLNNTYGIASAYQASDVFVCPSIEESGPTMINQSIMCGTPVVSFEMGVALDLVIDGKTGYRVKLKDSYALAKGIYDVLSMTKAECDYVQQTCRNLALETYHPDVVIEKWLQMLNAAVKNKTL